MRAFFILLAIVATLCVGRSACADETYGSWAVGIGDDKTFVYAATGNDSGGILGEYCYPEKGSCIWTIGVSTRCELDHIYPVLANADSGSRQLDVSCTGHSSGGLYFYSFTNFEQIDDLVKGASKVGFATPLQADEFRVIRFLLNGSSAAIASMRNSASKLNVGHTKGKTGTRDQDI